MARRRQPRREAELVEPVQLADLDRQEPLDAGRIRAEVRPVDPHPDHRRTRGRPGRRSRSREHVGRRRDVGDPRPDQVAQDRPRCRPSRPITNSGCGVGPLYSRTSAMGCVAVPGHAPAGPRELALLEVADRVRGVQPVALEEGAQEGPVRRRPGDDRRRGRPRPSPSVGHQPARPRRVRRVGPDRAEARHGRPAGVAARGRGAAGRPRTARGRPLPR